jgi:hypothetical protein
LYTQLSIFFREGKRKERVNQSIIRKISIMSRNNFGYYDNDFEFRNYSIIDKRVYTFKRKVFVVVFLILTYYFLCHLPQLCYPWYSSRIWSNMKGSILCITKREEKKDTLLLRDYRTQISLAMQYGQNAYMRAHDIPEDYYIILSRCVCTIQLAAALLSSAVTMNYMWIRGNQYELPQAIRWMIRRS